MKSLMLFTAALLAVGVTGSSCATKKQVRAEVDRRVSTVEGRVETVEGRMGEAEETSQRTSSELRRLEEETRAGLSDAKGRADAARSTAESAEGKSDQLAQEVSRIDSRIADFDKYVFARQSTVYFQTGKWELSSQAMADLDALARSIEDREGYRIEIQGFTDATGSHELNERLSQWRAEATLRYLVERHEIPVFRVGLIGLGSNKPVSDNRTSRGRAENRRVEIRLYANPASRKGDEIAPQARPARVSKDQ
ncbi:MAG: OmpA family protein [Acidobacteria bacterium]|nr:OmpA family protein [Acidobacteriota bacterium]